MMAVAMHLSLLLETMASLRNQITHTRQSLALAAQTRKVPVLARSLGTETFRPTVSGHCCRLWLISLFP
ncbi:oryzain beta chain [Phtheirospermum japonicum]|uniref:Oryzain beta chain n=1 Tax=Phtheirospermum japonicum TaxID=374723 RepID=A0A830CAP4_9LAMI|nr:oryzain beta chain [Phtheirospermum japonicum]